MKKMIFVLFICCFAGGAYFMANNGSKNFNTVDWETVSVAEVRFLIFLGADVNARNTYGITPLMLAASRNRNPAVIETLINAGADVNAKDQGGRTALMWARKHNKNSAVIDVLINASALGGSGGIP